MSSNGSKNDLDKLLDRMDALKEKIEGNPEMMAAFRAALADPAVRQSARQKVLKARGIEEKTAEIDAAWLEEQLRESRIDVAVMLCNVTAKTIWMNTKAAFKCIGRAVRIIWDAGRTSTRMKRRG